ncbi:hypothetical protein [Amycolatopsis sp. DSM 110486]|uniref:hypothetical protein n=1 Tax=Amycolatopsis sp. DSM 110486 TaxID=2865832 RepID=UPI001C69CA39|nr:hypothetical protein [Amycolatopsis sp. DSM 110486]QYN19077.1 hypothetical protein K1T34_41450 [Amycolatopsis sp. DSM 110486]
MFVLAADTGRLGAWLPGRICAREGEPPGLDVGVYPVDGADRPPVVLTALRTGCGSGVATA